MKTIDSPSGAHVIVDGKEILNFAGSCYLGLCAETTIIEAAKAAVEKNGAFAQIPKHYGFTASAYSDIENTAAEYFETEGAIYFAGGYFFGAMALQGLKDSYDVILLDEISHYSLQDGAMTTGKPIMRFRHSDVEDFKRVFDKCIAEGKTPIVAVDGLFPTYGDFSPLDKYFEIIKPYDVRMVIDESHAFGVLGDNGKGAVEKFGLPRDRVLAGGSLAKGFCAYGGITVGPKEVMDKIAVAPVARGAANGMTSAAAASAASLKYVKEHPEALQKLRENTKHIKDGMKALGFPVADTESPVVTFALGDAENMKRIHRELLENEGVLVIYSTYIGADANGVLRVAVFGDHTFDDIDRFLSLMAKYKD